MTRHRRNPMRWIAGLLVPVFLCAHLLDVVHYATVEHAPCPIDGALAHVGDGHVHADGEHAAEPRGGDEGPSKPHVAPGPEDEHGHDHCSLLLLSKKVQPVLGTDLVELGPAPVSHATPWMPAPQEPGVPLFLLAPKNSPPRAS